MREIFLRRMAAAGLAVLAAAGFTACGAKTSSAAETELTVFIAASLNSVMEEVAQRYNEEHPEVHILYNADSSGTLLTQIEEGFVCDVFFSAAQKQMDALEADGLLVEGTRHDVVNNQLVVISRVDSKTAVHGLEDLAQAQSIALADGTVPAGRYARVALMRLGLLAEREDASGYTTKEVSEALGGVEISEQSNVSKVLTAVKEGSCEVGIVYYSDTHGYEDELRILQVVGYDLTGNIIYPIAQVVNEEEDEARQNAAASFTEFVVSDQAAEIFTAYGFDTQVH